jgi:ribosomal small subunit protein bTHX
MGKGDTKTKRGKINSGSYGNARKKVRGTVAKPADAKKTTTKAAPAKPAAKRAVKK